MELEFYLFIFTAGAIAGVSFFRKVTEMLAGGGSEQATQTVGSIEVSTEPTVDMSAINEELASLRHNERILEGTIDDLQLVVSNLRDDLAEKSHLLEQHQHQIPSSPADVDDVDRVIDFEPFDPTTADPRQLFIRNSELSAQVVELEDRLFETQQCLLDKVEQLNEFEKCRHVEIVTPSPLQSITRVDIPIEMEMEMAMNTTPTEPFVPPQADIDAGMASDASNELPSLSPLRTIPVEVEDDAASSCSSPSNFTSSETVFTSQTTNRRGGELNVCRTFGSLDLSDAPPSVSASAPTSATTEPMSAATTWEEYKEKDPVSIPTITPFTNTITNTEDVMSSSVVSSRRTSFSSVDNSKYLDSMEDRVAKLKQKMQRMKDLGIERRM